MTTDPSALLVGPRGRRLCLELAVASTQGTITRSADTEQAEELRLAVFHAAYALDPGRGTSRWMVTAWAGDGDGALPSRPEPTPAEVARLLDAARLPEPDAGTLGRALEAAVDHARYWQEPDGEDVLAASPEVRRALGRVAARVAGSPGTAWWTDPLDRDAQWTVTPLDVPWAAPVRAPAADRLARWRAETVAEEQTASRERPRDPRASWSGTWWSTAPVGLTRTTRALGDLGPVGLRLVEDAFGWGRATVRRATLTDGARVHEVDGPDAWADLCRRYPLEVTASRRHDWYRTTGVDSRWVVPDWSRAAADLDAVHLTVAGYLATAGRAVVVGEGLCTVLAGWDPDATCWLVDVPDGESDEQIWERDDDGVWAPRGD